mmetsp:Transcript_6624/g.16866  ORF Transcript_6624/g.16866 Transcript_6624/m.16866 type:complete len:276 (-) Transcript_6624:85-912(-)
MAAEGGEESAKQASPTPIFGQGSTFTGTGFSGFNASAAGFAAASAKSEERSESAAANPEAECEAEFKPIVQLEQVEAQSGEEAEVTKLELKAKLYRYDFENQEWKERGLGQVKILEHHENKRLRLLMRREKTLKICANHLIMPGTEIQEHAGNDKAWVWSTPDFAEEEMKNELFCIRFGTVEKAGDFKKAFEDAVETNTRLIGEEGAGEAEAEDDAGAEESKEEEKQETAEDLAAAVESVKVSDEETKPKEESEQQEEPKEPQKEEEGADEEKSS